MDRKPPRRPTIDTTIPFAAEELELARRPPQQAAVSLVVYHRRGTTSAPIAEDRPCVVGRADPAHLVIPDESLSRQHARFELGEGQVWVEDLGSTNGTCLNGERVERAPVKIGDEVTLGAITAAIYGPVTGGGVHGLLGHGHFQALLAYEVQRARTFGRGLAVVMVAGEGPLSRWSEQLRQELRPVDQAALYAPQLVEVLLPELDEESARQLATKVTARGKGALRCGLALFPSLASSADELIAVSRAALRSATPEEPVGLAPDRHPAAGAPDADQTIVRSPAMREVYDLVDRVAASTIPVLINGETGTGKELVARAIHQRSPRSRGPIFCLNCGAIPTQLTESALFGHERGAFTGASERRKGAFEAADGGMVFLDEIGELPAEAQAALLRVLETGKLIRVGGTQEIVVDVRIVAATHRELDAMVLDGAFRQDLLYRLNAVVIRLPPLRERPEEIEPLAEHFLATAERRLRGIEPDAMRALTRHAWPGNVRELRNAIERAVVIARGDTICLADLPEPICSLALGTGELEAVPRGAAAGPRPEQPTATESVLGHELDFKARVQRFEATLIERALLECDHNKSETSRRLRIPMRTLVDKIQRYELGKP